MLCVLILYMSLRDLQLEDDFERQIFDKLFMEIFYLLSEFLAVFCCEEIAEEIFFRIPFCLISQCTTY